MIITALAGGVGAARFLTGLVRKIPEEDLTIISNTGDDIELYGLHVSPDIDIVVYTLAGIVDKRKGWGIQDDTFNSLNMLEAYGYDTWFRVGDKDLATHVFRTFLLKQGVPLSATVENLSKALEIKARIIPMSEERVETRVRTNEGTMHLQEYLVKRNCIPRVKAIEYAGLESAQPAAGVIDSILASDGVIICPSNPFVSIGPILALKGVRESLKTSRAKKIAITPLIAGRPVKGPLDKMLAGLGLEVSSSTIAGLYKDFIDVFVLDKIDRVEIDRIENYGVKAVTAKTLMKGLKDKIKLAEVVLKEVALDD